MLIPSDLKDINSIQLNRFTDTRTLTQQTAIKRVQDQGYWEAPLKNQDRKRGEERTEGQITETSRKREHFVFFVDVNEQMF